MLAFSDRGICYSLSDVTVDALHHFCCPFGFLYVFAVPHLKMLLGFTFYSLGIIHWTLAFAFILTS